MSPVARIGQAVEHDQAMPITPRKAVTLGQAVEHDEALPITPYIAPAAVAALVLSLPSSHPHQLLHDDPIAVSTEAAVAFAAVLVAIHLAVKQYRS
jgi:hypothetical protein